MKSNYKPCLTFKLSSFQCMKVTSRAREPTQCLKIFAALSEETTSVPITYMTALTNSIQRILYCLLDMEDTIHTWCPCMYACRQALKHLRYETKQMIVLSYIHRIYGLIQLIFPCPCTENSLLLYNA